MPHARHKRTNNGAEGERHETWHKGRSESIGWLLQIPKNPFSNIFARLPPPLSTEYVMVYWSVFDLVEYLTIMWAALSRIYLCVCVEEENSTAHTSYMHKRNRDPFHQFISIFFSFWMKRLWLVRVFVCASVQPESRDRPSRLQARTCVCAVRVSLFFFGRVEEFCLLSFLVRLYRSTSESNATFKSISICDWVRNLFIFQFFSIRFGAIAAITTAAAANGSKRICRFETDLFCVISYPIFDVRLNWATVVVVVVEQILRIRARLICVCCVWMRSCSFSF